MKIDTKKLAKLIETEVGDIARLPGCCGGEVAIGRVKGVTIKIVTATDDDEEVHSANESFKYAGHPITHENDDCYCITTLEGMMHFKRGDMLITGVKGEIYPCKADIFAATYEPA